MNISKDNINGVKNLPGVNVTSCIVPCTDEDNYATHDSFYGKGGWREVRTHNDLFSIPMERRTLGMAVYVTQENKLYVLKYALNNACWYEFNPSNIGDIINDAISKGQVNIDFTNCVTQDTLETMLSSYITAEDSADADSVAVESVKHWVEDKNYLTEHQSLEALATKEEVEAVSGRVDEIDDTIADLASDLSLLETKHDDFADDVESKLTTITSEIADIEEIISGSPTIDFATREEVAAVAENLEAVSAREQEDYNLLRDNVSLIAETYETKEASDTKINTVNETLTESINTLNSAVALRPTTAEVSNIISTGGYITRNYLRGYATEFYVQDYVACVMAGKVQPGKPVKDYDAQILELQNKVAELEARVAELEG